MGCEIIKNILLLIKNNMDHLGIKCLAQNLTLQEGYHKESKRVMPTVRLFLCLDLELGRGLVWVELDR